LLLASSATRNGLWSNLSRPQSPLPSMQRLPAALLKWTCLLRSNAGYDRLEQAVRPEDVLRLSNKPGIFIVMPMSSSISLSGMIPPEQTFRGTEQEIRKVLVAKGQSSSHIQMLIERAKSSPEFNIPEYVEMRTLPVS
jgi:hypothetical protein